MTWHTKALHNITRSNHSAGFRGLAPFFFTVCFLRVDGQSYYFCWKESLLRSGTTFLANGWRCEKSPWVVVKITSTSWFLGTFLRAVITKGDMFPLRSRILRKSYVLRGNAWLGNLCCHVCTTSGTQRPGVKQKNNRKMAFAMVEIGQSSTKLDIIVVE